MEIEVSSEIISVLSAYVSLWYRDGLGNTIENWHLLPNPNVLVVDMWAVKLCCNEILRF